MRIGIDPGKTGTIAVVSDPHFTYMHHWPMPLVQVGKKTRVNGAALAGILKDFAGMQPVINLELVHALPGEAASGSFSFGHSLGVVEGVLQSLGFPYNYVTPQAWKKQAGLIGTEKDAARSRAIQLYPRLHDLEAKIKGQALADALLIARYTAAS